MQLKQVKGFNKSGGHRLFLLLAPFLFSVKLSAKIADKPVRSNDEKYLLANNSAIEHKTDRSLDIQSQITGRVTDTLGKVIPGVTILVTATNLQTQTDADGRYQIAARKGQTLHFRNVGYMDQKITIGDKNIVDVTLKSNNTGIDEVIVVGFGTQKRKNVVGAVTSVNVKDLKGPTSNLTTMLAGRIAGVISYQRSGEPGRDNAQFFVRGLGSFGGGKVDPLILIDGIESNPTDLARLQPDDISSFSVLKDATAAAVYGARGANGVMLINTKLGSDGVTKFNFRVENSISSNTKNFQMADNITYMEMANEGSFTRNPLSPLAYSLAKIDYTKAGADELLYPNNDWMKLMIKDYTMNQRYNMNISGGGNVAQYYVAGTYNVDNGVLKNDSENKFGNNITLRNYSIRANNTLNITKTTNLILRVYGMFDDYTGPRGGGEGVFKSVTKANPVAFPVVYPGELSPYREHLLFGNAVVPGQPGQLYTNPYANMVSGFHRYSTSTINAQVQLEQDFSFILPGLKARGMGYVNRYARTSSSRSYQPFYYMPSNNEGVITLNPLNDGAAGSIGPVGREYLDYAGGDKEQYSSFYSELAVNYSKTFADKHDVSGMVIGLFQDGIDGGSGSLEGSLPRRNLGLSGRFSYVFDSRYLMEFNFGYNGSERFAENNRWGFFPSIGVAWSLSNEKFFDSLKDKISTLKLRGSYGMVGNDAIGDRNARFFYMSNVNLNNGDYGSSFGTLGEYYRPGVSISRYANNMIGWEESRQLNLGLDLTVFGVEMIVDAYRQKRSNILMTRTYAPGTMGLQASMVANIGKAESQGVDVGFTYNKSFAHGMWTQLRTNFTLATNKATVFDEPAYPENEPYRTRVGQSANQQWGYIAERLFVDDYEVDNSPTQFFGSGNQAEYGAGDIKYRDVNQDGVINNADQVPIGLPTTPQVIYGFGGTFGYKGFDVSAFFQGSARSAFFIDPGAISPFVNNGGNQNGLLNVIAEDHWSEDNRNLYAFWPRLSTIQNNNNNQSSTWWMRNGDFLRLKNVDMGYTLPDKTLKRLRLSNCRIYLSGSNLFSVSKFKTWDVEMGGDGLGYPVQRVYNIGISLGL